MFNVFSPLESKGNYSATSNNMKLVHWPLMGGLLHLVQRGGDWAGYGIVGFNVPLDTIIGHFGDDFTGQ